MDVQLPDEAATIALGRAVAHQVRLGEIVFLSGNLGAGKTTFARAFIQTRGWKEAVRSPSFSLLAIYELQPPIFHADLYRVGSAEGIGLEDLLGRSIGIVEWPEHGGDFFEGEPIWRVELRVDGAGRVAQLSAPHGRSLPPEFPAAISSLA